MCLGKRVGRLHRNEPRSRYPSWLRVLGCDGEEFCFKHKFLQLPGLLCMVEILQWYYELEAVISRISKVGQGTTTDVGLSLDTCL
jgi:hypothetical protein